MVKRVLVTGAPGFIGHYLVDHLLKTTDWEIVTLDRLDYSGNLNRLNYVVSQYPESIRKRVKTVFHDLRAEIPSLTRNMIGDVQIIFGLAAASHVDRSIEAPMEFVLDNVVGCVNLLNYARTLPNLERLFYFSTDEIYGVAPGLIAWKEWDRYNSTNPYSASKASASEFCVAFHNTYKLPIVLTNTMNVIGERQHPEKFVPKVIRKILLGETIHIHSDISKTQPGTRFYIHAKDVAEAYEHLLSKSYDELSEERRAYYHENCPKFNIVGKEEVDNLTLVQWIAEAVGQKANYELVDFHSSRPGHDLRYSLNGEKLKRLGWEPKLPIRERIHEIVNWTLQNKKWIEL